MDGPGLFETFVVLENVTPVSVERLKKMSEFPGVLSLHAMLMFPAASNANFGATELPGLLDTLRGAEKVTPLSADVENEISSWKPRRSSQTT